MTEYQARFSVDPDSRLAVYLTIDGIEHRLSLREAEEISDALSAETQKGVEQIAGELDELT